MAPSFLHNMIMISIFISFTNFPHLVQSVDSEARALKEFKANIVGDPLMFLANWTNNSLVCYWKGITCTPHRVAYLDLSNAQLSGTISPQIGGLRYLRYLNLSLNQFSGVVPLQLSFCSLLRSIDLTSNSLVGSLPEALGNWSRLEYLNISHNQLTGNIPGSVGDLSKLKILDLRYNNLTGTIPASLSNCSLLNTLNLDANMLTGKIPEEFGRLQRLEDLTLGTLAGTKFDSRNFANMLSGPIPASLSNCSHLRTLSLNRNNLNGTIPDVWANLKALQTFHVWQNNLTGTIPLSLTNCTQLLSLDLGNNQISGTIPHQLGYLFNLNALHLGDNLLQGPIPASLGNCSKLQVRFWLYQNNLSGHIPDSVWTLYSLSHLAFDSNRLVGELPPKAGYLTQLTSLSLSGNYLSGNLPSSLGQLKQLQGLYLYLNNFEGPIPSSLGNLTQLTVLALSFNNLTGSIPNIFQNKLQYAYFQRNRLDGTVPSVARLSSLLNLDMSHNLLYGAVPSLCASSLFLLQYFKISHNSLTASIPESLEKCVALETLDLSSNNLSGEIPAFLGTMKNLIFLNLSNNMLSGPVPNAGIFRNASEVYLDGNSGLCGSIINKTCLNTTTTTNNHHHAGHFHKTYIIYIVLGTLAILIMITCISYLLWKYHPQATTDDEYALLPQHMKFSKDDLCMATNNFSDGNIIGTGGFSIVYKGIMAKEQLVAVKKLTMTNSDQTKKSFFRELETLGKLRHRNLVNILGYCNTLDMMAIVLEFMPNGSLRDHLYKLDPNLLEWRKRLNIAIGVAQGLLYLHHESREAIVHCDIKPENILLDHTFEAHIADFGIAMLVDDGTLSSFRGSFGYMAPELSQGKPTPMSDVYSYGILLVELITRKRPTDKLFMEDDSMEKFLQRAMSNDLGMVVDEAISKDVFAFESMLKVLEISSKCLAYDPKSRPNISSVLARLTVIRDEENGKYRKDATIDVLISEPSPYPSTLTGSREGATFSPTVVPR